jgi:hypothetical protein
MLVSARVSEPSKTRESSNFIPPPTDFTLPRIVTL